MVTGKRLQAIELDNGDIQVSVVIPRDQRAAFFEAAPTPGFVIKISNADIDTIQVAAPAPIIGTISTGQNGPAKPPTQSIAPAGAAPGQVGPAMTSRQAVEVKTLCDNPWFQQFAAEKLGMRGEHDSLETAKRLVTREVMQGAAWDSNCGERWKGLVADYTTWCSAKGYRQ